MMTLLAQAARDRLLRPLDVQFSRMIAGDDDPRLQLAAAILSAEVGPVMFACHYAIYSQNCYSVGGNPIYHWRYGRRRARQIKHSGYRHYKTPQ